MPGYLPLHASSFLTTIRWPSSRIRYDLGCFQPWSKIHRWNPILRFVFVWPIVVRFLLHPTESAVRPISPPYLVLVVVKLSVAKFWLLVCSTATVPMLILADEVLGLSASYRRLFCFSLPTVGNMSWSASLGR